MNGQCLNKYLDWINLAANGKESFYSEDIDWFLGSVPKQQWFILGLSFLFMTKHLLEKKGTMCPIGLCYSLQSSNRHGNIPNKLSDQLFRRVNAAPTLYILKGYNKSSFIAEEKSFLTSFERINLQSTQLTSLFDIFYCEKKDDGINNTYYDRYIMLVL